MRSRFLGGIAFLILSTFLIVLGAVFIVSIVFAFVGIPLLIIGVIILLISIFSLVFGTLGDLVNLARRPFLRKRYKKDKGKGEKIIEVEKKDEVYRAKL